jgi:hypothetical protein
MAIAMARAGVVAKIVDDRRGVLPLEPEAAAS